MIAGVLASSVLILLIRVSDAVDYDDWDDSIPAEILSQPVGIGAGSSEEKGPKLWPNRTGIPYMIDSTFSQAQQISIQQALRKVERSTGGCVMFKKRTDEKDYALLKWSSSDCLVAIPGMQGGEQRVYLTNRCASSLRNIQHEIMHLLGFDHEHSRPDRNDYTAVQYAEITYSDTDQFTIETRALTGGTKYDYNSITQYGPFSASSSDRPTSVPKKGLTVHTGRLTHLSQGDVAKIKIGYKCPLRITSSSTGHVTNLVEPFPNFSLEPMTYSQCKLQYNDYCASSYTTLSSCDTSKILNIVCYDNATEHVLREMSIGMADGALRAVHLIMTEQNLATYSFTPLRRQVICLHIRSCTTNRFTGRLIPLNFSNLLEFWMVDCTEIVVLKGDFASSRKLRNINFMDSTITMLQMHTFTNLPDLRIISLERIWDKYERFAGPWQTYLYKLHCSCEFAWYRQWWRANKKLKLRVEQGELYSIAGAIDSSSYDKKDLYHPINCKASPFPLGPQWINYYGQIEYSINEPDCEKFQRCRNVLQAVSSECM